MTKLLKFLKPYAGAVAAIICVLIVQAYCDLSLPAYTSDIVNVGIQQSGIDEKVPEQISEEDLGKLLMLVPSDQQEEVQNAYEESKADHSYDGKVFSLKESVKEDKEKLESLEEVLAKPMLLAAGSAFDSDMAGQLQANMQQPMQPEQREEMLKELYNQMEKVPDMMLEQSAPVYIKGLYENIGIDTDKIETHYILNTGGKMLALAGLGMAASVLVGLLASRVGASVGRGLRRDVFRKVVGFSNGEFDKFSTASLITRSTNDIQQIQLLTVMILRMVLYAPILAIGGIYQVFHTNVDMSWIIALAVGIIVAIVLVLFLIVMPKFKVVQNQVDRLNLVSREILTGLPVIRAFSTQKHEEERFDEANKALTRTNLFVNRAMTFMMPLMMLVMNAISILIIWVGGHSINDGAMQVGDMMAFIQYTMQIIMAFLMICMISIMLPRAAVSATRVDEVLTSTTLINDPKQPKHLKEGKGMVDLDHVSFRFPGAEEDWLHDISFTAKPGETTAIIGSTGSGKSTMVNLIPRFYDATEGEIDIAGENVREYTYESLRKMISVVPQKAQLFAGTIRDNLMFGCPDATEEQIEEALVISQAKEFVDTKEGRLDAVVEQGGKNLSGGQRQRLTLARALVPQSDILIMDDSASALDYATDAKLRKAIQNMKRKPTVFIVSQRTSSIQDADSILVLDDGKIAGKGTHEELIASCDIYREIYETQFKKEEA